MKHLIVILLFSFISLGLKDCSESEGIKVLKELRDEMAAIKESLDGPHQKNKQYMDSLKINKPEMKATIDKSYAPILVEAEKSINALDAEIKKIDAILADKKRMKEFVKMAKNPKKLEEEVKTLENRFKALISKAEANNGISSIVRESKLLEQKILNSSASFDPTRFELKNEGKVYLDTMLNNLFVVLEGYREKAIAKINPSDIPREKIIVRVLGYADATGFNNSALDKIIIDLAKNKHGKTLPKDETVKGKTDKDELLNKVLSSERAEAVMKYLIAKIKKKYNDVAIEHIYEGRGTENPYLDKSYGKDDARRRICLITLTFTVEVKK